MKPLLYGYPQQPARVPVLGEPLEVVIACARIEDAEAERQGMNIVYTEGEDDEDDPDDKGEDLRCFIVNG